jgi:diguanylate cyclase (GGDEF)-like protein/PAS domain S-box-containing protein
LPAALQKGNDANNHRQRARHGRKKGRLMATILVVDDRPSNREYLLALLGCARHRTLQARDGAEALDLVRNEQPDLVITDILMPTMNGYEFVRSLRADPALAATPVVFYSAVYSVDETAAIARSCGVRTVLSKPADPPAIFAAINAELGTDGPDDTDAFASPTLAPLTASSDTPPGPVECWLRALEALCLRLAGERHPESLVETFIASAAPLLAADHLALCLLGSDETHVRHFGLHGIDRALLHDAALGPDRLPGSLKQLDAALRLVGPAANAALPEGHPAAGCFLGLPVRDTQHRLGWMYATRAPGADPFSDDDERVAVMIAAHLAVAYENINLYRLVQGHAAQLQLEAGAREKAVAALRESRHRLILARQVFDSTAEAIMMTDAQANVVAANPAFERITGYSEDEVLGRNPRMLRSGRHDGAFFDAMWRDLSSSGQWRGEIWNRRKDGDIYPERMSISAVHDEQGQVSAYVSVSTDLSALKAAHHQLDYLANHDTLTGLPNRTLFFDRLQRAIAAVRGGGQLAVLMFNVDRLQRINDSLGHVAGDAALREIAARAAALAGPSDTAARLGGDEFVLLLTRCDDTEDVIVAARTLVDSIARPIRVAGHDVVLTASTGISMYPRDGATPGDLLRAADAAVAHAREEGRNGFRFFKGEMNAHALRWLALESSLRRSIERHELVLHYQPQVAPHDGAIVGMEALLRWDSPELGRVAPCDFIPLAEDTGLIVPLGGWVIREACRQNKAWQDAGLSQVRVAVNVSAYQVRAANLVAVVRQALEETGLSPSCLELELTETVMMGDSSLAQQQLGELRALGVTVSLDDFGTGYASLGYLSRFTLDKLKIDQSFVRDITDNQRSAAIAQATVALAEGMSLTVVAEGVETIAQRDYLHGIGCHALQGYLYSPPLPAAEMAALLCKPHLLHNGA